MPAFPPAAKSIATGLAAEHGFSPQVQTLSLDPQLVESGHILSLKETGLDCRQCHGLEAITPRQPNDAQGISFLHMRDRLRRGYYDRWMHDPLRIDPATKMPKFAPDGKHTPVRGILEGNAARQYDALWHYIQSRPK
jgi:hypothetical protein